MKTLVALAALSAALLAGAPAVAQDRPNPRETAIISTMNDVYAVMNEKDRKAVDQHLARARAALKAGKDAEYEKELDEAMMIVAKAIQQSMKVSPG